MSYNNIYHTIKDKTFYNIKSRDEQVVVLGVSDMPTNNS